MGRGTYVRKVNARKERKQAQAILGYEDIWNK
jgi:hypothetical protein